MILRNGALPCWLGFALLAACGADSSAGEPAALSPGGNDEPASGPAETLGGSAEGGSSAACRQPTPPQLCLLVPEGTVPRSVDRGQNLYAATWRLGAEVAALEPGPLEQALSSHDCSLGNGEPAAPDTHLEWLRLELDTGTAWVALSAPADGLRVQTGDRVEVEYTIVDDLLRDFGPKTLSLVLRDRDGEPLAWLATADSIASLGEHAPPGVTLRRGAAQCQTADRCERFEQYELEIGVGDRELVLAQGELAGDSAWRALAGRSEVVTGPSGDCSVEGYTQLASLALWRLPE